MNKKVLELIEAEKARLADSRKSQRDQHLISLGLVDEGSSTRLYVDKYISDDPKLQYDGEKQQYFKETLAAVNVTEQEYEEICRYFPIDSEEVDEPSSEERALNVVAGITLVLGLICTSVLFSTMAFVDTGNSGKEFSLTGFVFAVSVLLITISTWATLRVLSNISYSLRQLNGKAK